MVCGLLGGYLCGVGPCGADASLLPPPRWPLVFQGSNGDNAIGVDPPRRSTHA